MPISKFGQSVANYMENAIQKTFPTVTPVTPVESTFQIFVRTGKGTITLDVSASDTGLDVKNKIAKKAGLPVSADYWLSYSTTSLGENETVESKKITKEATLEVRMRGRGGIGEYEAIQQFLAAKIGHGNVTGLRTKESVLAVAISRGYEPTLVTEIKTVTDAITFDPAYSNPGLQALCKNSVVVEGLGGGNCNEMANWAAVKLIENTTDQWVYVYSFDGTFTLDASLSGTPGYPPDNQLDHVMVVTYPEDAAIGAMDVNKATVVDVWFDNLTCSLKDYMATKHPYYNYKYASNKPITLTAANFALQNKFKAIGKPFSADLSTAESGMATIKRKVALISLAIDPATVATKYEFVVDKSRVQDVRSKENLENLLKEAKKVNKHIAEVDLFTVSTFQEILKTSDGTVKGILYEALDGAANATLKNFIQSATLGQLDDCIKVKPARLKTFIDKNIVELTTAIYALLNAKFTAEYLVGLGTALNGYLTKDNQHIRAALDKKVTEINVAVYNWLDTNLTKEMLAILSPYFNAYIAQDNRHLRAAMSKNVAEIDTAIYKGLRTAQLFNAFCDAATVPQIKTFFTSQFPLYVFDAELSSFMDSIFANSTNHRITILKAIDANMLGYYAFSSADTYITLRGLGGIANELNTGITQILASAPNIATELIQKCALDKVNTIIHLTLAADSKLGIAMLNALDQPRFEGFILRNANLQTLLSGSNESALNKAIYALLKKFGIKTNNETYKAALGNYAWAGYKG